MMRRFPRKLPTFMHKAALIVSTKTQVAESTVNFQEALMHLSAHVQTRVN